MDEAKRGGGGEISERREERAADEAEVRGAAPRHRHLPLGVPAGVGTYKRRLRRAALSTMR